MEYWVNEKFNPLISSLELSEIPHSITPSIYPSNTPAFVPVCTEIFVEYAEAIRTSSPSTGED
jgi:hypothetical protein